MTRPTHVSCRDETGRFLTPPRLQRLNPTSRMANLGTLLTEFSCMQQQVKGKRTMNLCLVLCTATGKQSTYTLLVYSLIYSFRSQLFVARCFAVEDFKFWWSLRILTATASWHLGWALRIESGNHCR